MWALYRVYSDDICDTTPPDFELPKDKQDLWPLTRAAARERNHVFSAPDAVKWIQRGHDAGHILCTDELAGFYESGQLGLKQDTAKAVVLMKSAVERGSYISMMVLAQDYLEGYCDLAKNPAEASKIFAAALPIMQRNAALGDARSKYWLARIYRNGYAGTDKDVNKSVSLVREAAEGGNAAAMSTLARFLLNGADGVTVNKAEGLRWLRKSVEARSPIGMWRLAHLIRDGAIDDQDTYITWLERAHERGCPLASLDLAEAYENGSDRLPKDHARALQLYAAAADGGDDNAMVCLGAFATHPGKEHDLAAAAAWFQRAAALDNPTALVTLARMHRMGEGGLEKSDTKAAALLQRAVDLNDPQAMVDLAHLYASGLGGLPEDPARARDLVNKAAELGNEEAKKLVRKSRGK